MTISLELENTQKLIIQIHRSLFDESPTPMKLQKLCYYAQGYALADSLELFSEDFQAWQHGPVIPDLYLKYKNYQWRPINDEIIPPELQHHDLIEAVVSAYGQYDGAALSTMTHRETPWLETRAGLNESDGCDRIITKASIKNFFSKKLKASDEH